MRLVNSEENIIWHKCRNCGLLQHNTHRRCLKCKNDDFEIIEASGTCKLLTYTILKAPPAEFRDIKTNLSKNLRKLRRKGSICLCV